MEIALLIGRLIVGIYYLMSAANHFTQLNGLTGYAASKGVPAPKLATFAAGVLLLAGGLTILTGYRPEIGVSALVLFFLPVTFMMHQYWKVQDPMARMGEQINFMKNMALMGSSLMFLAIPGPWPFSLSQ